MVRVLVPVLGCLVGLSLLEVPAGAVAPADASAAPQRVLQSRSAPADPRKDHPQMPRRCVGEAIIPPRPMACRVVWHGTNRPTLVLWGDSHAWQHLPALRRAAGQRRANVVTFFMGACPPFKVYRSKRHGEFRTTCERLNHMALRWVTRQERRGMRLQVVLGSIWEGNRRRYRRMRNDAFNPDYAAWERELTRLAWHGQPKLFTALGRRGIDADVIAQGVMVPSRVAPCPQGEDPYVCSFPRRRGIPREDRTRRWLGSQMAKLPGRPRYIDPNQAVCGPRRCHGMIRGTYTFYDQHHYSASRSVTFAPFFRATVRETR